MQDKDQMVREFKFFHGVTIESEGIQGIIRTLRAQWRPELQQDILTYDTIDAEEELTRILSEEIAREVDENIVTELTRRINGGDRNINYLDRWLNIGENNEGQRA